MFEILVLGTLFTGVVSLLANLLPFGRQQPGTRRMLGIVGSPASVDRNADRNTVRKTDEQWQLQLSPEQYRIARQGGTEPAFTGQFWNHHEHGTYRCVGCGQALFESETKFESRSGWPSYFQPSVADAVTEIKDISGGLVRTEVICSRCESHLGHVFPDGPQPTGLRYCINSASLTFEKDAEDAAQ